MTTDNDFIDKKKYGFIICNNDPYDGLKRPRHILSEYLGSSGYKVLFQSPPVIRLNQRKNKSTLKYGGLKMVSKNVFWHQPLTVLPFVHRPIIGEFLTIFRAIITLAIAKVLIGKNRIYFVTTPHADNLKLVNIDRKSIVFYNIHDRYTDVNGVWPKSHFMLGKRADALLVTSEYLMREISSTFPDKPIYMFPAGIDLRKFEDQTSIVETLPPSVGRVTVGCVGNLGSQIDWGLMLELSNNPNLNFIFVGPVNEDLNSCENFRQIKSRSNVKFIGSVEHEQVPNYIKTFDICAIPFVKNEFTNGVNPLKLLEYLALGKIVISTRIPYTEYFSEIIEIGDTPAEWLKLINSSLSANSPTKIAARKNYVSKSGYAERVKLLVELTDSIRNKKTSI